jgi:diguanylate cyclase (GGDEF)-like protein/PAS domain S-box-containing protein
MIDDAFARGPETRFVFDTSLSHLIGNTLARPYRWRARRAGLTRGLWRGDRWFGNDPTDQEGALSKKLIGRLYATLFMVSGLVTAASPFLPEPEGVNRTGILAIGAIAIIAGLIVWHLPWESWRRSASMILVPIAFTMIAFHNFFGGSDPYRFGLFFMVAFVGLGIAHPQWSCVKMAPFFVLAYLAPFLATRPFPWDSASSVVYAVSGRLRDARVALWTSEERFRSLVQNASDIVLVVDTDGCLEYLSPSATNRMRGAEASMAARQPLSAWIHPEDVDHLNGLIASCLRAPKGTAHAELRYRHRDQSWRYVEAIASNLTNEPSVAGIVITARDIHDRKSLEAELVHQAFHDPLTSLANRALFIDRLQHALNRSAARGGTVAVLFLDIDQFKVINDSLGHHIGDELLVALGERLRKVVRPSDTIARMGGDEFTLLLEDVDCPGDVEAAARQIQESMTSPFSLLGHEVFASCSIGITISGERGLSDAGQLLRSADVAMYQAKSRGSGRFEVFDPHMDQSAHRRLELEQGLRWALDRQEFELHYQPFISLHTDEVVGYEALLRWRHPHRGLIPPSAFIAVAEDTGLIIPVGEWVLRESCRTASRWMKAGTGAPLISVNLSTRQLLESSLIENVAAIIDETGHDPSRLVLEITESLVMVETPAVLQTLHTLKRLGVRLAIDDFGTGYSSLSYLKSLPVDLVKIDRAFVTEIHNNAQDAAIVRAIIEVAHSLDLQVVAEGVDSKDNLQLLKEMGCDLAQGYYLGKPSVLAD